MKIKKMSGSVLLNNLLLQKHVHTAINQLFHRRDMEETNSALKLESKNDFE
jgi:hypothetical protein